MSGEKWRDAKKFALNHWPEALAATLTVSGAAAFLLIRYCKQKKLSENTRRELEVLEQETKVGYQETPVLLETGISVIKQIPGSADIAKIMATSIPDETGREAMSTLGEMEGHGLRRGK